ncbi:MAG: hypothetical protein JWL90_1418 [Chthoniobacteraceae bacterium]|nr:hypothetical protein [Chthoniobacteraceae bacterium]
MKFLGFLSGVLVAIVIWIATFFIATILVDKVSFDYRNAGVAAGLVLLGAGAVAGRKAWTSIEANCEHAVRQSKRRREAKRAEVQRLLREQSQIHADQRGLESILHRRLETSRETAAGLPALVTEAGRALDFAEQALVSGQYGAFWDAIHGAVLHFATLNASLETLARNARLYQKDATNLRIAPPLFTLGDAKLPVYDASIERLRAVIQLAQISHEFATFYELRKSGADQVPGFVSLSRAMIEMGGRLDDSVKDLAAALAGNPARIEERAAVEISSLRTETPMVGKLLGRVTKVGI